MGVHAELFYKIGVLTVLSSASLLCKVRQGFVMACQGDNETNASHHLEVDRC